MLCFHCGDPCGSSSLKADGKVFCCHGCKSVYQIIMDFRLGKYYEISNRPGSKKNEELFHDFEYLDLPSVRQGLLQFSSGGMEAATLQVPSVHCSSCIWLLENLSKVESGIVKSEVDFLRKEVRLLYKNDKTSIRKISELLDRLGYRPMITLGEAERKNAMKKRDQALLYRIGIAGFAFGNIMLLSFPEYLSGGLYDEEGFARFFAWLNFFLALPVFLYCATPFLESAWKGARSGFLNIDLPLSLGIIVLFLQSAIEVILDTGPGYFDSMAGLVFFLLIGRWIQGRTYQALSFEKDHSTYFPLGVRRVTAGGIETTLPGKLAEGDVILVRNGEVIPTDANVLTDGANIDYSFVTGEAGIVNIAIGGEVYAGGRQKGGEIRLKVIRSFAKSRLMQLWKNENSSDQRGKQLSRLIDRISQYFTAIILIIAAAAFILHLGDGLAAAIHVAASVLIVACPCALAMTLPFTYGNGLRNLQRSKFFLKDPRFVGQVANISDIVFDKTGTITQAGDHIATFTGRILSGEEKSMIRGLTAQSSHPVSRMIHNSLGPGPMAVMENFSEVAGQGMKALSCKNELWLGTHEFVKGTDARKSPGTYLRINGDDAGHFEVANVYRPGLQDLVARLRPRFRLHVITGDEDGERENLQRIFGSGVEMHFRMSPFDKLAYVENLRKEGKKVMMVGDGLNDAGAIRASDAGLSVSEEIHAFLPSCDGIIEASSLSGMAEFMAYCRRLKSLAISGFIISFSYNLAGLAVALTSGLSPIIAAVLMPLSSVTVVSFAVLTTNLAAGRLKRN